MQDNYTWQIKKAGELNQLPHLGFIRVKAPECYHDESTELVGARIYGKKDGKF